MITGTIVNNKSEAIEFIVDNNPNCSDAHWITHVADRIPRYPMNIAYCRDEKTGSRFGRSECRRHLNPIKIGGGGRNRGSINAYQLWIWDIE